jgi:hypothetical protein
MTIRKLLLGTVAALLLAVSPAYALSDQGFESAATLSMYHGSDCGPLPAKSWQVLHQLLQEPTSVAEAKALHDAQIRIYDEQHANLVQWCVTTRA